MNEFKTFKTFLAPNSLEKMSLNIFLAFLLASSIVQSQELNPKNIFLLAGQGNIVGLGGINNNTWDMKIPTKSPFILRLSSNKT